MRKVTLIILCSIFCNIIFAQGTLQKIKERATQKVNNKIDSKIDSTLDKGINAPEDALNKAVEKNKTTNSAVDNEEEKVLETVPKSGTETSMPIEAKLYSKFDFIPADSTILYDDLSNETTDEIPSKWKVYSGRVEVKQLGTEKVIQIPGNESNYNTSSFSPRFKNDAPYLPYRFTAEFDLYFKYNENISAGVINIGFCKPDESGNFYSENCNDVMLGNLKEPLQFYDNGELDKIKFGSFTGQFSDVEKLKNSWVHVSIAVTEKSMKVYYNNERVLNAQMDESKANVFAFSMQNLSDVFLKNIRLAAGGRDPYKQTTLSGKFIARGLKFETGKATLKPESISELNRIVKLMTEHPELNFEIGGHASKSGNVSDANNQTLSEARAKAVMVKLIEMGVAATKLTAKGYGDKTPIDNNASAEGKINNQRVELKIMK